MSFSHQQNSQGRDQVDVVRSDRSSKNLQGKKFCRFFMKKGTCRHGANCWNLHETGLTRTPTAAIRQSVTAANTEARYQYSKYNKWKNLLEQKPPFVNHMDVLMSFWLQALWIIDSSDIDYGYLMVRDLTEPNYHGRQYITKTLKLKASDARWKAVLLTIRDMLCFITHHKILDCMTIDYSINTMYEVISGSDGNDFILLLLSLCNNLKDSRGITSHELVDFVSLVLRATHELLAREKQVASCEHLPALLDKLELIIPSLGTESERQVMIGKLELLRV